jgi:DNA-binding NarL/FixJ family response regulator
MIDVVLVDDHELVRTGFMMILQQPDIRICGEAGTAEEGLRLIWATKPHIALVDVHMPGMSGIELQRCLAAEPRRIPIIFVTAHGNAALRDCLMQAGAAGFLNKPVRSAVLLKEINEALDRK